MWSTPMWPGVPGDVRGGPPTISRWHPALPVVPIILLQAAEDLGHGVRQGCRFRWGRCWCCSGLWSARGLGGRWCGCLASLNRRWHRLPQGSLFSARWGNGLGSWLWQRVYPALHRSLVEISEVALPYRDRGRGHRPRSIQCLFLAHHRLHLQMINFRLRVNCRPFLVGQTRYRHGHCHLNPGCCPLLFPIYPGGRQVYPGVKSAPRSMTSKAARKHAGDS